MRGVEAHHRSVLGCNATLLTHNGCDSTPKWYQGSRLQSGIRETGSAEARHLPMPDTGSPTYALYMHGSYIYGISSRIGRLGSRTFFSVPLGKHSGMTQQALPQIWLHAQPVLLAYLPAFPRLASASWLRCPGGVHSPCHSHLSLDAAGWRLVGDPLPLLLGKSTALSLLCLRQEEVR